MRWAATIMVAATACCAPWTAAAQDAAVERENAAAGPSIDELISQLGDDQFAVRRRAEEELLRRGPDAYDQLKLAEDHDDLEISERVRYILERLRVEWVRDTDSAEIRRMLARFEDLSEEAKNLRIQRLAELEDAAGLGALCRIARLEPSPRIARRAALEVVERAAYSFAAQIPASPAIDAELDASQREPAEWIRQARADLGQDADPAPWSAFAAAEAKLLAEPSADSDFVSLYRLLRHQLATSLKSGDAEQIAAAWRQVIELDPRIAARAQRLAGLVLLLETQAGLRTQELVNLDTTEIENLYDYYRFESGPAFYTGGSADDHGGKQMMIDAIFFSLQWALDQRQAPAAEALLATYAQEIEKNRGLLYFAAALRASAGQSDLAQQTADQALALKAKTDQDHRLAYLIGEMGQVDWAMREYQKIIADSDGPTRASMNASEGLAVWLHDRQDDQAAADVLETFNKSVSNDRAARRRLLEQLDELNGDGSQIDQLRARRDFFLAAYHESRGELDLQREMLKKAADAFESDADILIALYRAAGADEQLKQETLARIEKLSVSLHAPIERIPDETPYKRDKATCYNQWAWLVSNTTGDYARAVEYSQRSLQLVPGEASYLDTLGRCYYAAGDLDSAVKTQREAVKRAPHYGVMRRQLEQFEHELASKKP